LTTLLNAACYVRTSLDGCKNKEPGGYEKSNQKPAACVLTGIARIFFMPGKAAHNPRRTTQRKLRLSKPDGMKSYQVDDYFCRQTYELLNHPSFKLGNRAILPLIPAVCNGTSHAKSI
jgi:hypothetical protein